MEGMTSAVLSDYIDPWDNDRLTNSTIVGMISSTLSSKSDLGCISPGHVLIGDSLIYF